MSKGLAGLIFHFQAVCATAVHVSIDSDGCIEHYSKRVLVNQIYRTRDNRSFCKENGIQLSAPKLGRLNPVTVKADKKLEYKAQMRLDNTDRIGVKREFSVDKRCYGTGRIATKLEQTQHTSIVLSVFDANLFKIQRRILCALFYLYKIFWKKLSS